MTTIEQDEAAAPDAVAAARRPSAWLRVGVPLVPAGLVAIGGWLHRWNSDDAFINYRVVEQVMAGHGPVFNGGERIEAVTSPLWMWALVAARATVGQVVDLVWIGVILGLLLAVAGFAIGGWATRRVHVGAVPVPLGLVVVAALPVVWDFATAGLELGLVYCWLGGCWAALVMVACADSPPNGRTRVALLVLLGLGPLLRPDLALMSFAFVATWWYLTRPVIPRLLADVAIAFAFPLVYQVFRMGYYGSLVPSTALAKDAGGIHLGQGIDYAEDLFGTYALWLPLLVVAAVLVHATKQRPRRLAAATLGMAGAGIAHGAYMVAIGGDYMHGRLLIPALLAFALPASVGIAPGSAAAPARVAGGVTIVVIAVWAVTCVGWVRYENEDTLGVAMISDWRVGPRPYVDPNEPQRGWLTGEEVAELYASGARGKIPVLGSSVDPTEGGDRLVFELGSIGLAGYNAGIDVHVVDIGGLAEPLAARSKPHADRPAGHRKDIDRAWYDARFGVVTDAPKVAAAREALECGPVDDVLDAATEKMTPGRFFSNLWRSPSLTRVRIPNDPEDAVARWC